MFIFIPVSGYTFYKGYSALCRTPKEPKALKIYIVLQGLLCLLWIIFCIVSGGVWNGFAQLGIPQNGFSVFLNIVEAVGYLLAGALGGFCIYKSL